MPLPTISPDKLQYWSELGEGSFARVTKQLWKEQGRFVAVKTALPFPKLTEALEREAEIMLQLGTHDHIIELLGMVDSSPKSIVTALALMDLADLIESDNARYQTPQFFDQYKYSIIGGIIRGVAFIHAKQVAHRDIKSDNILLDQLFCPKLADFGAAIEYSNQELYPYNRTDAFGTITYLAPEVLRWEPYSPFAIDMYSLGIVLNEILTRLLTDDGFKFSSDTSDAEISTMVRGGHRPTLTTHQGFAELISNLWNADPAIRPNASETLIKVTELTQANATPSRIPLDAIGEEEEEEAEMEDSGTHSPIPSYRSPAHSLLFTSGNKEFSALTLDAVMEEAEEETCEP